MARDDLFAGEEEVIATGERLLANGSFSTAADKQHYEQLLKSYQKLFRVTRRMMRLSDSNERQLNTAADVISRSTRSSRRSPPSCRNIFRRRSTIRSSPARKTWRSPRRARSSRSSSDVVNFTETTDKLESEELTSLLNTI
jgi:adenylate cyclase